MSARQEGGSESRSSGHWLGVFLPTPLLPLRDSEKSLLSVSSLMLEENAPRHPCR